MKDSRAGLNCTLSYRALSKTLHTYRCRVNAYSHGYVMNAEEGGQARLSRAFYPHRVTVDRFTITVQLNGYREWVSFNTWMTAYARNLTDATMLSEGRSPVMSVTLAGRQFHRLGIPISGYGFGDHLGAVLWQPMVVFESATDPYDGGYAQPSFYRDTDAVLADKVNAPYFYPFSQYSSGTTDGGHYDEVVEVDSEPQQSTSVSVNVDDSRVQAILNGLKF
jgi:hypothetical protein